MTDSDLERFWTKVRKSDGCWIWTAGLRSGYGSFWLNGKNKFAHVISYRIAGRVVPAGLELDHLCRNRSCLNPDHLEPVTRAVNMARGQVNDKKRSMTHCEAGHEYSESNTRIENGMRRCRQCILRRTKAYQSRNIEEVRRRDRERKFRKYHGITQSL